MFPRPSHRCLPPEVVGADELFERVLPGLGAGAEVAVFGQKALEHIEVTLVVVEPVTIDELVRSEVIMLAH
jgi:hypothetical protein